MAEDDEHQDLSNQTPLLQAAIAHHEMFTNYVEGGFTQVQALMLIAHIIAAQGMDRKCPNCGHEL